MILEDFATQKIKCTRWLILMWVVFPMGIFFRFCTTVPPFRRRMARWTEISRKQRRENKLPQPSMTLSKATRTLWWVCLVCAAPSAWTQSHQLECWALALLCCFNVPSGGRHTQTCTFVHAGRFAGSPRVKKGSPWNTCSSWFINKSPMGGKKKQKRQPTFVFAEHLLNQAGGNPRHAGTVGVLQNPRGKPTLRPPVEPLNWAWPYKRFDTGYASIRSQHPHGLN